jgi:hypothetical protein
MDDLCYGFMDDDNDNDAAAVAADDYCSHK